MGKEEKRDEMRMGPRRCRTHAYSLTRICLWDPSGTPRNRGVGGRGTYCCMLVKWCLFRLICFATSSCSSSENGSPHVDPNSDKLLHIAICLCLAACPYPPGRHFTGLRCHPGTAVAFVTDHTLTPKIQVRCLRKKVPFSDYWFSVPPLPPLPQC